MSEPSLLGAIARGLSGPSRGGELVKAAPQALSTVDSNRGWFSVIREPFTGAWQRNEELRLDTAFSSPPLFRCISLISSDVAKCPPGLFEKDSDGIWHETTSPSFSPVLTKPNRYQNRIQFISSWMQSKLATGNTVVLKERDGRGVVVRLYVLDWARCTPLVAPDGSVFYNLAADNLAGLETAAIAVPASEIIHDRWNTLFHPLVGLSPIYACGLSAMQGVEIQRHSTKFFRNGARPGGVLTAPTTIGQETADRLRKDWDEKFTGDNVGKIAVLGDGLKYESFATDAIDAQLIEQLKLSGETVCGTYGVPPYMAGVGPPPLNANVQNQAEIYYSQCLQIHIESFELCMDEGLELQKVDGKTYGVALDLDVLLRMDSATQIKTLAEGVKGGLYSPNEGRRKLNLGKVKGGAAVYLQQQNYSLEALAKRDAKDDPFSSAKPAEPAADASPPVAANDDEAQAARALVALVKGLA